MQYIAAAGGGMEIFMDKVFVITKLLGALDLNAIIFVPLFFVLFFFVNYFLLRTVFTWLAKIRIIGIFIMIIYALVGIVTALGMFLLVMEKEFDGMAVYCAFDVLLAIAVFSFNYLTYSPLFGNVYTDGAYFAEYDHTEHHIFSPNIHYYRETWHEWHYTGAKAAVGVSWKIGVGVFILALIFNPLIVLGLYAVVRLIYKLLKKDDDTLSY